jgi:hypothetical protein
MIRLSSALVILLLPLSLAAQIPLTIEGVDTIVTTPAGYNIPNNEPTDLIFRNNAIISTSSSGFIVQAGEDDYNAYAYNLDGALIFGNRLSWDGASGGTHGIMVGYSIDYEIKYNYIDNSRYGPVHEGGLPGGISMVNTSGGIYYNILKDCYIGIVEKGFDYTPIYNNTFYSDQETLVFILVASSGTGGFDAVCRNVKIKNNIFYSTVANHAIVLGNAGDDTPEEIDTVGFECDYNIYYYPNRPNNEPVFEYLGQHMTWDEWRALGYDQHSVILDPEFVDTNSFIPAARLDHGADLGAEFEYGLATTAQWIVGQSPDVTRQNGIWQVGAVVYPGDDPDGGDDEEVVDEPDGGVIDDDDGDDDQDSLTETDDTPDYDLDGVDSQNDAGDVADPIVTGGCGCGAPYGCRLWWGAILAAYILRRRRF